MQIINANSAVVLVLVVIVIEPMTVTRGQFSWIRQPSNITAIVGADVFIPCEFSGVGRVLPYWRHDGREFYSLNLPPGYRLNITSSGLIITGIMALMNMSSCSCFVDLFDGSHHESTVGYITLYEVGELPFQVTNTRCPCTTTRYHAESEAVSTNVATGATVIATIVTNSLTIDGSHKNQSKDSAGSKFSKSIMWIGLAGTGILAVNGVFIVFVGITAWIRKHKGKQTVIQGPIYEEPSFPEPVYEQVQMPTYTDHEKSAIHNSSHKDYYTADPKTDVNVAYQLTGKQFNQTIIMKECSAYQL